MYVPTHFNEDRISILHKTITQIGFGTLVTCGQEGLEASHLPMLLDSETTSLGVLHGHVARANLQWSRTNSDVQALAIFLGPDAYITPSWYATKKETGKVVPTWNYLAIHAYGDVIFYDDRTKLLALVERLTDAHEQRRSNPWAVNDAPSDYIDKMLAGIVGFEINVKRLEGKWKMSQNRNKQDFAGVQEGLASETGHSQKAVAGLMAQLANDPGSN